MNLNTFISNWSDSYFSAKEKGLKRARISSLLILLAVLLSFGLNAYYFLQMYGVTPFEDLDIRVNLVKAGIYQLVIIFGLLIRFVSLRFNSHYALRFAEFGIFLAFSAWLGYFVWSTMLRVEISKIADVNWSSHLMNLEGSFAVLISIGFVVWVFYKIIFLIAVTWRTVRK